MAESLQAILHTKIYCASATVSVLFWYVGLLMASQSFFGVSLLCTSAQFAAGKSHPTPTMALIVARASRMALTCTFSVAWTESGYAGLTRISATYAAVAQGARCMSAAAAADPNHDTWMKE